MKNQPICFVCAYVCMFVFKICYMYVCVVMFSFGVFASWI